MRGSFVGLTDAIDREKKITEWHVGNALGKQFADRERIYDKAHEYIDAMKRAHKEAGEPVSYYAPLDGSTPNWIFYS